MTRILIIEDEMLIAVTLEAMLVELGHEVVGIAGRLDEAMETVGSLDFDVAVLDLKLGTEMTFRSRTDLSSWTRGSSSPLDLTRPRLMAATASLCSRSHTTKPP